MGGSAKRVIAVVAAIAIPYLAPKIAGYVFTSGAISAAAANTITGAALGFGVAKATGGDPLLGAVGGGAGGYFGGGGGDIFGPGTPAGGGASASGASASGASASGVNYSVTGGGATPPLTPPTAAPTTIPMTTTLAPADYSLAGGLAAPSSGLSFGGAEGLQAAAFDVAPSAAGLSTTAATDFGAQLSGAAPGAAGFTPVDYGITGAPPSQLLASNDVTTFAPADYSLSGTAAGVPSAAAPSAAPSAGLATGSAMGSAPGSGISTTATGAAIAPTTLGEKAWAFTKSVGGDLLKTAAVLTAIGQPNIPGEIPSDLLAQYEQDFARLAQENPAAYQAKLQEAQKFLQMASTFDPQYFGEEEARKAQIRGARAKREGLRGLTGRQRDAAERKFDLETGRSSGTSYTQGAQRALTGQIQTQEAGLKLMPRPSEYTLTGAYKDFGNIYTGQAGARRQYATDIGNLADQATSIYNKGRDIFSS